MSDSESDLFAGDDHEPTKGELVETIRGLEARVEKAEEENDELRQRVDELERTQNDMASNNVVNHVIAGLVGHDHVDFNADPVQNRNLVQDFADRVDTLETDMARLSELEDRLDSGESNGPQEAWNRIVEKAKNLETSSNHGLPNNRVQLYRDDIVGATGKSEQQASRYIDYFGGDPQTDDADDGKHAKRGATKKPYRPPSEGKPQRRKALVVDLDVWGGDDD